METRDTAPATPAGDQPNETDIDLDWQDGFHWTTGAMHGYPPGGRP